MAVGLLTLSGAAFGEVVYEDKDIQSFMMDGIAGLAFRAGTASRSQSRVGVQDTVLIVPSRTEERLREQPSSLSLSLETL